MRRFRFTIGSLVGFVLMCGVAFAALRESSEWWERGTFTFTVLVLLTSLLLASHRMGERRAFWFGFALFGCVYLGLALIPPVESRLVTSCALEELHVRLSGQTTQQVVLTITSSGSGVTNQTLAFSPDGTTVAANGSGSVPLFYLQTAKWLPGWRGSTMNFVKIGHSLIALLLAWLGGIMSVRLARRAARQASAGPRRSLSPPVGELLRRGAGRGLTGVNGRLENLGMKDARPIRAKHGLRPRLSFSAFGRVASLLSLGAIIAIVSYVLFSGDSRLWVYSAALCGITIAVIWVVTFAVGSFVLIPVSIWRLGRRLVRAISGRVAPRGEVWDRWMDGPEPLAH